MPSILVRGFDEKTIWHLKERAVAMGARCRRGQGDPGVRGGYGYHERGAPVGLDTYIRCPLRYRLQYVDRVEPDFVPAWFVWTVGLLTEHRSACSVKSPGDLGPGGDVTLLL